MWPAIIRLCDILNVIYACAFLFHPAILFYLRHRLKLRIPLWVTCILSIFLGWTWMLLPLFVNDVLPETVRGRWCPEGPAGVFVVVGGWMIAGFLLLMWVPLLVAVGGRIARRDAIHEAAGRP